MTNDDATARELLQRAAETFKELLRRDDLAKEDDAIWLSDYEFYLRTPQQADGQRGDGLAAVVREALNNCVIDNHGGADDYDCAFCNKARAALNALSSPAPDSTLTARWGFNDDIVGPESGGGYFQAASHNDALAAVRLHNTALEARQPAPDTQGATDIERMAEAVHQAYLDTCDRLGWGVKPENLVSYAELSEDSKELDRASVRAVLNAIPDTQGRPRCICFERAPTTGWSIDCPIHGQPAPDTQGSEGLRAALRLLSIIDECASAESENKLPKTTGEMSPDELAIFNSGAEAWGRVLAIRDWAQSARAALTAAPAVEEGE